MNEARGVLLGGQGHLAGLSLIPLGTAAGMDTDRALLGKRHKSSWFRSLQTAPRAAARGD